MPVFTPSIIIRTLLSSSFVLPGDVLSQQEQTKMLPALLQPIVRGFCVVWIKCAKGRQDGSILSSDVRVPRKAPQPASPPLSLTPQSFGRLSSRISNTDRLG